MNVIVFASRKGGCGKTTFAINMAVLASREARTCLVDMDPQQSVAAWNRLRRQRGIVDPVTTICPPQGLPNLLAQLRRKKCDWVCIDTPPNVTAPVHAALQAADLVVIPVRPDVINFDAVTNTIVLAQQYRKPYLTVINEAPPLRNETPSPLMREARQEVKATALKPLYYGKLWKGQITHRNAIAYAHNRGLGVVELGREDACIQEFERCWQALKRLVRGG